MIILIESALKINEGRKEKLMEKKSHNIIGKGKLGSIF